MKRNQRIRRPAPSKQAQRYALLQRMRTHIPRGEPANQPIFLTPFGIDLVGLQQTQSSHFINVGDPPYGAPSDGITDASTIINLAISQSAPNSIIVFPGNHAVGSTIILLPNRTYIGTMGFFNGFTFQQMAGKNLPAVLASTDWYNNNSFCGFPLRIYNVDIDGNSANNSSAHGLALTNFNAIVDSCSASNTPQSGFLLSANTRNGSLISNGMVQPRVKDCSTANNGTYGVSISDSSHGKITDGYLENCTIGSSTLDNIIFDTAGGWHIEKNHVFGGQQSGITVSHCFDTFIRGNYVDGFGFNSSAPPGTFYNGLYAGLLAGGRTVISDNLVDTVGTVANTTYEFLSVQATDNTGTNYATVHDNMCIGANVSNHNMFAFDNHVAAQQMVINEWNNDAQNYLAASNLYVLNNSGGGSLPTFPAIQSQNGIRPNNQSAIYTVSGVPPNSLGANGEYAFRIDTPGTANQRLYVKSAGAWVGIV